MLLTIIVQNILTKYTVSTSILSGKCTGFEKAFIIFQDPVTPFTGLFLENSVFI